MVLDFVTNQRSRDPVHIFLELCMHIIEALFSLTQSVLLEISLSRPDYSSQHANRGEGNGC